MDEFEVIKLNSKIINIDDASDEKLAEYLEKLSNNKDAYRKSIDEILNSYEN